jgi:hypothetical protein
LKQSTLSTEFNNNKKIVANWTKKKRRFNTVKKRNSLSIFGKGITWSKEEKKQTKIDVTERPVLTVQMAILSLFSLEKNSYFFL